MSKTTFCSFALIFLLFCPALGLPQKQFDNDGGVFGSYFSTTLSPSRQQQQQEHNDDHPYEKMDKNSPFPHGGFMPPRTGWKWWRYHEMSDKEILDHLLNVQHYDKREKPPSSPARSSSVVLVNVSMTITSMKKLPAESLIAVQGLMVHRWFDPRLIHEDRRATKSSYLNAIHHFNNIWMPALHFRSHGAFKATEALEIYPNGTVISITRFEMSLACQGEPARFPFDDLRCTSQLESLSYPKEEITFEWWPSSSLFHEATQSSDAIQLLGEGSRDFWPSDCSSSRRPIAGNYSCLEVGIHLGRDLGQYWSDLFLPDITLVATSFLTFWLDWSSVPARTILGVGTMLCYFSNNRWSLQSLLSMATPANANSLSALDLWRAVSLAFIYGACAEFVLVNYLGSRGGGSAKRPKVSQSHLEEILEHQQQKMQQQLERIRFEANSKAAVLSAAASQGKFDRTATLMRHHHRPQQQSNLAVILDPRLPNSFSQQSFSGMQQQQQPPMVLSEEPMFTPATTPHYEKINVGGARTRCFVNLAIHLDRLCRVVFPLAYLVFVTCYFSKYSS